jgi:aminocarboxymuconate-semialdehyde decarboxylase
MSDSKFQKPNITRRGFLGLGCCAAAVHGLFDAEAAVGAQRKSSGNGGIDVHAHFFPHAFIKSMTEEGGPPGIRFDFSTSPPLLIVGSGRVPLDDTYWDLDKRVKRMDDQGITTQALSLTVPMVHWAPPMRGAALARIVNDAMIAANTAFPNRFVGCAAMPIQDAVLAVKEIDRLKGNPAIRGVYLPTWPGNHELSDPSLFPIYERCEALNLPVLLHPVAVIGSDRLGSFYLANLLGNPFDTAVAASYLVFGGVLDRYPRLKVVLPHAGGAVPYLVGRLEHGQDVRPEARGVAKMPYKEYMRRNFYYDTITHSPELLQFLIGYVGIDRVMIGSDYCFDMGYDRPRDIVNQLHLTPAEKEKIFTGNAARLLNL